MSKSIRSIGLISRSFQMNFFFDYHTSNLIYQIENYSGLDYINNVLRYEDYVEYGFDDLNLFEDCYDDEFLTPEDFSFLDTSIERMKLVRLIWSFSDNFKTLNNRTPTLEELFCSYHDFGNLNMPEWISFKDLDLFKEDIIIGTKTFLRFFYSHHKLFIKTIWKYYFNEKINLSKSISICTVALKKEIDKLLDNYTSYNHTSSNCYFNFVLRDSVFDEAISNSLRLK